ncbi:MAG: hypothetical protein AVDCRST_MAG20-2764, partial [uncultured Acidimicrobiales bacterium]
ARRREEPRRHAGRDAPGPPRGRGRPRPRRRLLRRRHQRRSHRQEPDGGGGGGPRGAVDVDVTSGRVARGASPGAGAPVPARLVGARQRRAAGGARPPPAADVRRAGRALRLRGRRAVDGRGAVVRLGPPAGRGAGLGRAARPAPSGGGRRAGADRRRRRGRGARGPGRGPRRRTALRAPDQGPRRPRAPADEARRGARPRLRHLTQRPPRPRAGRAVAVGGGARPAGRGVAPPALRRVQPERRADRVGPGRGRRPPRRRGGRSSGPGL